MSIDPDTHDDGLLAPDVRALDDALAALGRAARDGAPAGLTDRIVGVTAPLLRSGEGVPADAAGGVRLAASAGWRERVTAPRGLEHRVFERTRPALRGWRFPAGDTTPARARWRHSLRLAAVVAVAAGAGVLTWYSMRPLPTAPPTLVADDALAAFELAFTDDNGADAIFGDIGELMSSIESLAADAERLDARVGAEPDDPFGHTEGGAL